MSDVPETKEGKATFMIRVQFTCNSTWQGSISWMEGQKTQRFRSELEMMKLMMEAIKSEQLEDMNTW